MHFDHSLNFQYFAMKIKENIDKMLHYYMQIEWIN